MKWYEKQKKLYANQENENIEGEKGTVTSQNEEALDSVFMEAIDKYSLKEDAIVSYEEPLQQPLLEETVLEELRNVQVPDTIISASSNIQGDLEVVGDLYTSGNIVGNISCSGTIHVDSGSITGDVTAANTYVHDANITGNITSSNTLEILNNAQILGNISGESLTCNAYIKGDISIRGEILLMQQTLIEGNLTACYLKTEKGASLKGQCCIITGS